MALPHLPIEAALTDLLAALERATAAVLVAPPGAGKTTGVPPALLEAAWLDGRRILVLEPRRIAARAAAERMATLRAEKVGQTIGLRARLATRVGPRTRIEVITEGVFTRMVLDDPALDGVGAVLFDEFHERSLDADFGLALASDVQAGLREDLRILVMSATLDGARVSSLLGGAPVIESAGRAIPVDTRYLGRPADRRIEEAMVTAIRQALDNETGSILAFLPGQAEIRRVADRLTETELPPGTTIAPLYGALDARAQDDAIRPAPTGQRKVVLATAIAETSLTIEGVRIVIDSGLARVPRFDPGARVTRLETVRASRASVDQRCGRAGRLEPGVCYRLWAEPETRSLRPHEDPEIRAADLTGLLLDCAAWGVTDPATLSWLDPPTTPACAAARSTLQAIGALDASGRITDRGRNLRALPLPPHLAATVIAAAATGQLHEAASIAALLVERGLGGNGADIDDRLRAFDRDRGPRARATRDLAARWADIAESMTATDSALPERTTAGLLAHAYPDRIAMARGKPGEFLLANGRGARIDPAEPLAAERFLVVAEIIGSAAAGRITLAAALSDRELESIAGSRIRRTTELEFDRTARAVRARERRRLDALVLESRPVPVEPGEDATAMLCRGIAELGLDALPWSKAQTQLRNRVAFLRAAGADDWPDLSSDALANDIEHWLAPYLAGKTALSEIDASDLDAALSALLSWSLKKRLDDDAPTHFTAPTGNRHPVAYDGEHAPSVALRVQELFGLKQHPAIAGGRLPLTLVLLSPAGRPIQVTRDLPGFWSGSWRDVAADLKGRYPKHPWPDDPANAEPTAKAKPRRR
jgi:ATP-dependent RNA helicase HrpB